jgi:hypothetical protein
MTATLMLPAPRRTLALPAPPPRLMVNRKALGRLLRAVPSAAEPVISIPGGDGTPTLHWASGGVVQGRLLPARRVEAAAPRRYTLGQLERLAMICRASDADELELGFAGEDLVVRSSGKRWPITSCWQLAPPRRARGKVAAAPIVDPAREWLVDASALSIALSRAIAIAPRVNQLETKHVERFAAMLGVLLEFEPGGLRVVATDGRRLVSQEIPANRSGPDFRSAVVPPTAFRPMGDFCASRGPGTKVAVSATDDRWVVVRDPGTGKSLAFTPLSGRYPDWRDCLPDGPGVRLAFRAADLIPAVAVLRKLSAAAEYEQWPTLVLDAAPGSRTARLRLRVEDRETALELPLMSGPPERRVALALNPDYLEVCLKLLRKESAEVAIRYHDAASPATIGDVAGLTLLVMPAALPSWAREAKPATVAVPEPVVAPAHPKVPTVVARPRLARIDAGELPPERSPCIDCGTTRGRRNTYGCSYERSRDRCGVCYAKYRRATKTALCAR